jgi:hypothetical protein
MIRRIGFGVGVDMTLCIASVSRAQPRAHIVTVSDLMLSADYVSVETRVTKVEPISPTRRWIMMFAGSPSPISTIQLAVKQELLNANSTETEGDIRAAVEMAYKSELKREIETEILGPFGIDRETFIHRGRAWFGDQQFDRLAYEIADCRLDLDLLIAGFEPSGLPRIFSIGNPAGAFESHERTGFHAIGSGSIRGLGSLFTTYDPTLSKSQLAYRVCEAKFAGESALGVGEQTYVLTLALDTNGNAEYQSLYPEDVEKLIRPRWEAEGKPPIPNGLTEEIEKGLRPTKWMNWKNSKLIP